MPEIVKENSEQMNHVLFLDFDGPLFPNRFISFHAENSKPFPGVVMPEIISYWKMDPMSVEMLNQLQNTFAFTTVVSSSWRRFIDKEQCISLFRENGLNLVLADDWRTIRMDRPFGGFCARASEISEFIHRHKIEEFIVLDDAQSGYSLEDQPLTKLAEDDLDVFDEDKERVVLVNCDLGIGSRDFLQMRKIVRGWAGIPETIKGAWSL